MNTLKMEIENLRLISEESLYMGYVIKNILNSSKSDKSLRLCVKAMQRLHNLFLFLKLSLKISSEGPESYDILVQAYTDMNAYGTYHNDTEMRQKLWDYLESNYADDFLRSPPSHMPNGDINLHLN
ncbi:hypothetical protein GQX74_011243 [Glossina fuscipes]|uniref:Uncharacterized protein n=1 Tax=Glossina palpalis gambiensis TaxID=67801 RepID=A0A1B0BRF5_9MUSC|nr:hypothetical protein GQX74_011243 [Glossina fuscipes]